MKVEIEKIGKKIYHLRFSKQADLSKTFLRFQEHFESPQFRGKVFKLEDFKRWYKKTHKHRGKDKGKFTYYDDYCGYNIPSKILVPFRRGKFNPLNWREKWLLEQFKDVRGRFYIIGTYAERTRNVGGDTLRHEVAHAMFYCNPRYRKEVKSHLAKVDLTELKKALKKGGDYHKSVILDECHAYILNDLDWMHKTWKVQVGPFKKSHQVLKKVFKKYYAS